MKKLSCVLLVDDDKTTNFLNRLLLQNLAVTKEVVVAENGREALRALQQRDSTTQRPCLILLDVNMPVMTGIEFLEVYTKQEVAYKEGIVILMLTTSLHPRDVARLEHLPIQGFLNKPLTQQKVQHLLQQYFQREAELPVA